MKGRKGAIFAVPAILIFWGSHAAALPFNTDMAGSRTRTGALMRPAAPGAVSRGSLAARVKDKQDAEALVNTRLADPQSADNGRRLFLANCHACHGDISRRPYQPGPVAAKFMSPPDLINDYYRQKSDGYLYGTIHFGGLAVMPGLGWKLSPEEHWDIINFIRQVQKKEAEASQVQPAG